VVAYDPSDSYFPYSPWLISRHGFLYFVFSARRPPYPARSGFSHTIRVATSARVRPTPPFKRRWFNNLEQAFLPRVFHPHRWKALFSVHLAPGHRFLPAARCFIFFLFPYSVFFCLQPVPPPLSAPDAVNLACVPQTHSSLSFFPVFYFWRSVVCTVSVGSSVFLRLFFDDFASFCIRFSISTDRCPHFFLLNVHSGDRAYLWSATRRYRQVLLSPQ